MDNAVRDDIHALRDTYFWWLVASAVAVATGVAMEVVEVVKDVREKFFRYRPSEAAERVIVLISAFGWLLVAIGVGGEFVLEAMVSKADTTEQSFASILLADAQRQTAAATERAGDAIERTEILRGQNIRLAEDIIAMGNRAILLAPGDNRRRFVDSVRVLRGPQNVLVGACNAFAYDPEVQRLTREIADSLTDAGWTMPQDERGGPFIWYANMGMCAGIAKGADKGIWISVRSEKDKSMANLLLLAFKKARLQAVIWPRKEEDFLLYGRPGGTVQIDMLVTVLGNPAGRSNSTAAPLQSVMTGATIQ